MSLDQVIAYLKDGKDKAYPARKIETPTITYMIRCL